MKVTFSLNVMTVTAVAGYMHFCHYRWFSGDVTGAVHAGVHARTKLLSLHLKLLN